MTETFLTVSEAADRYHIAVDTLYRWIHKGVIGHVRVGPRHNSGKRRYIRIIESELAEVVTAEDQRGGEFTQTL